MLVVPISSANTAGSKVLKTKSRDVAAVQQRRKNRINQAQREAAARRLDAARKKAKNKPVKSSKVPASSVKLGAATPVTAANAKLAAMPMAGTSTVPDYFGIANWAFSPALRKFVDTLPGLGSANINNLGQYIPVGLADAVTYSGSDYYEIAIVQYKEKMHTDLPATTLRGYVQLETAVNAGSSKHIALKYPDGKPILSTNGSQVFAYDNPHYLGPTIMATKDKPVRIKFINYLPTGSGGDLFIPVDTSVMGAGMGPIDMPGMPGMKENYTQNRATLHLHGGRTPWISDGTPHQWITPAGENTSYPKGVSVKNVPDMPDPGPGAMTFFYTNQQSARLMFYHDHSYGITRLNVYAGEAAGYMITDQAEQNLISSGSVPADQIPLIIQDKTFVNAATIMTTDPTWSWGSLPGAAITGDLWMPHVYMPAQNPYDAAGVNPYGRWHYGPWFWPPTTNITQGPVPNPYYDPINAPWEPPQMPGTPSPSMGMESFFDTPLVNGTAFPTMTVQPKAYRFRVLNAANDRFWNLQLYLADTAVAASDGRRNTEVKMVPAKVTPNFPALWPTDGRVGGVPDPTTVGPDFLQIGTEGGFLPKPVLVKNQPIAWNTDPTTFNFGNVTDHALLLGPAERADVIVDFSQYAGKTLILYNDAPAAFPALDPRYDYYTGSPDLTGTGGYSGTPAGFGPNIRTIMQIKVAGGTPAPFNAAPLDTALPAAFVTSQDPIIVGQSSYDAAYGTVFPKVWPNWGVSGIQDTSLSFQTVSGTVMTLPMEPKAIQDEMGEAFDKQYGRMSGNLGIERPQTVAGIQNFFLYAYMDPASEIIQDSMTPMSPVAGDGTQIWKITHNGVDTHPIHFHLFDVQVINRVGWDGAIRMPDDNELGWKDTVRISPLEDTIVAMRPVAPKQPFGLPESIRPLDPTMPIGSTLGFSNIDPKTGLNFNPPISNQLTNFGWEYMWHCHILSHEEMDMMRPIILRVSTAFPATPGVNITQTGNQVNLSWTDGTPKNNPSTLGNPANEIGFRIERATVDAQGNTGAYTEVGSALANATSFIDYPTASGDYSYRVVAYNASGSSASAPHTIAITVAATTKAITLNSGWNLVGLTVNPVSATSGQPITFTSESLGNLMGADIVAGWATATQQYSSHIVGLPVNNFPIASDSGYFVHVNATSTTNITGTPLPATTPAVSTGWSLSNWTSALSTTAHALGLSVGADLIAKFDSLTQKFISHIVSLPVNNFAINQGEGIFIHKP